MRLDRMTFLDRDILEQELSLVAGIIISMISIPAMSTGFFPKAVDAGITSLLSRA